MIYLDSNIFIYAALNMKPAADNCIKMLEKAVKNEIEVCTSVLTWDEFFHSIKKNLGASYAAIESERLLKFLNLKFIDADIEVVSLAQRLTTKYNLGPRDAIHAASAILNRCKEIMSDDPDFDKIKEIKRIKL